MGTNNKFNNSPRYREKMRDAGAVESYQDAVKRTKENTIETIDRTSEGEILGIGVIEKLKNLREYLPGEMDFLYDFADFLSTRTNDELVPGGFNLMAELAIYDLTNGTDGFNNNQPISHKVAGYPAMMYSLTRHMLPKIAGAIFSEEYGGEVKQVQDEVFDSIKKKRLEENDKLIAPQGKFRVIGVDTFTRDEDNDWVQGDFDTLEEAQEEANKKGGEMTKMHIYDDQGNHKAHTGTF